MNIVIPLSGPDYFSNNEPKGLKFIQKYNGYFLRTVLESRQWYQYIEFSKYYFILQDTDYARTFAHSYLRVWFPGCNISFISNCTKGASFSVLIALSLFPKLNESFMIDLADIYIYGSVYQLEKLISNSSDFDAIAITTRSTDSGYSYFKTLPDSNIIIDAQEKEVISENASCGIYYFKDIHIFVSAIGSILQTL